MAITSEVMIRIEHKFVPNDAETMTKTGGKQLNKEWQNCFLIFVQTCFSYENLKSFGAK